MTSSYSAQAQMDLERTRELKSLGVGEDEIEEELFQQSRRQQQQQGKSRGTSPTDGDVKHGQGQIKMQTRQSNGNGLRSYLPQRLQKQLRGISSSSSSVSNVQSPAVVVSNGNVEGGHLIFISKAEAADTKPPRLSLSLDPADPEFIVRFIHRVERAPLLYNPDNENFRNVIMKQAEWNKVAAEFGQPAAWCSRKWVSLRDYFVKRKKLIRSGGRPGRAWVYYNEMKFLNCIYGEDDDLITKPEATTPANESSDGFLQDAYNYQQDDISSNDGHEIINEYGEYDYDPDNDNDNPEVEVEVNVEEDLEQEFDNDQDQDLGTLSYNFMTSNSRNRSNDNSNLVNAYVSSINNTKRRRIECNRSNVDNYNVSYDMGNSSSSRYQDYEQEDAEVVNVNNTDDNVQLIDNNTSASGGGPGDTTQSENRDAYDYFGLMVAAHMKQMPKAAAFRLQKRILDLMMD